MPRQTAQHTFFFNDTIIIIIVSSVIWRWAAWVPTTKKTRWKDKKKNKATKSVRQYVQQRYLFVVYLLFIWLKFHFFSQTLPFGWGREYLLHNEESRKSSRFGQTDQIDHDLDHRDPNLPLWCVVQDLKHAVQGQPIKHTSCRSYGSDQATWATRSHKIRISMVWNT